MSRGDCGGRRTELVERAFTGDLSGWRRRRMRRHLAECATCRDHYDRLATVDALLGAVRPLSRGGEAAVEAAVLAAVAPPAWYRRPAVWGSVGVVAAAGIALLLLRPGDDDSLRRRGGEGVGRTPGARFFCVRGDGEAANVTGDGRVASVAAPAAAIGCRIDDALQLAYTTPTREGLTMIAFARRGDEVLYYAPRPGEGQAVSLHADRVDEPLPWSTRLRVRHRVGKYELVVRFYDRPVTVDDVHVAPLAELRGKLEVTP